MLCASLRICFLASPDTPPYKLTENDANSSRIADMLKRNPKISKHVAFVSCAAGISRSHQDLSFSSFATGFFSIPHASRTTSLACSPSFHHAYEMWFWHVMNRDTTLPYSADRSWNKPLSFAHSSCLFAQQEMFQDLHDCYLRSSRVVLQFLYVEG